MPLGAFRINGIAKQFSLTAEITVIRRKVGISAIGNAQVSTAQSKFGGASALFDGSDDYISTITRSMPGYEDELTLECWAYFNSTGSQVLVSNKNASDGSVTNNANVLALVNGVLSWSNGSVWAGGTTTLQTGQWYHCAASRQGGTLRIFLNGVQEHTSTQTVNLTNDRLATIGAFESGGAPLNGYIDEVRISNNARYTADFTPQTSPHVNDDNTLLLIHADGTNGSTYFEDDNGVRSKVGLSAVGNAQVSTAQSKFGGASALFDGSGDYLIVQDESLANVDNYNNWTIEGWVYPTNVSGVKSLFSKRLSGGTLNGYWLVINDGGGTTGALQLVSWNNDVATVNYSTTALQVNTWYHVAWVVEGDNWKLFVNGNLEIDTPYPGGNDSVKLWISADQPNQDRGWVGNLGEVRISNTARYTANFTPASQPFVNDANTLLLLHADGTDGSTYFEDDNGVRLKKGVQAIGNAQVTTAQSKFGGASLDPGTDGLIVANTNDDFNFGTSDFTIEYWIWHNSVPQTSYIHYDPRDGSSSNVPVTYTNGSNVQFWTNGSARISTSYSLSTWQHFAVCRTNGTTTLYKDGVSQGTYADSNNYTGSGADVHIGDEHNVQRPLDGHIDEFRISNVARYTANFTPQTEPFSNDENTLLLLHMNGTNGSTVFTDDNGVAPKTIQG